MSEKVEGNHGGQNSSSASGTQKEGDLSLLPSEYILPLITSLSKLDTRYEQVECLRKWQAALLAIDPVGVSEEAFGVFEATVLALSERINKGETGQIIIELQNGAQQNTNSPVLS
jgi:hypothetical protein